MYSLELDKKSKRTDIYKSFSFNVSDTSFFFLVLCTAIDYKVNGIPLLHFSVSLFLTYNVMYFFVNRKISPNIIGVFLFLTYCILQMLFSGSVFDKSVLGFVLYVSSVSLYIHNNRFRLQSLIGNYYHFAIFICMTCVIQQVGFQLKLPLLYDFSNFGFVSRVTSSGPFLRVYSFFSEPSSLATILLIPLGIVIHDIIFKLGRTKRSHQLLLVITVLMTFSFTPYMLLFFFICYFHYKKNKIRLFLYMPIIVLAGLLLFIFSENLMDKLASLNMQDDELLTGKGASAFAIYSTLYVNIRTFIENPFFGYGFNSFQDNYFRFITEYIPMSLEMAEKVMKSSASMFPQLLADFGLFGLLLIISIIKPYRKDMLFKAIFIGYMIVLLRNGSYFNVPNIFLFVLFSFVRKNKVFSF